MKKTLLCLMLGAAIAVSAQNKKIFIDTHVSGPNLTFSLYKKQVDNSYLILKTGTSTGNYQFDSLTAGVYRVHQSMDYAKYIPTWHPMQALWENATDIDLTTADSFACTQGMLPNPALTGPASITGTLTEGSLKTKGDPLKNVRVIILSSTNAFVTMRSSNDSGNFSITGLPVGTYKIRTDLINTVDANPKTVVLDSANLTSVVKLTVSKTGSVNTGIKNTIAAKAKVSLSVYPNPSNGMIDIEVEKAGATFTIFNISGQLMMTGELKNTVNHYDLTGLPKGIYFIQVEDHITKINLQ